MYDLLNCKIICSLIFRINEEFGNSAEVSLLLPAHLAPVVVDEEGRAAVLSLIPTAVCGKILLSIFTEGISSAD